MPDEPIRVPGMLLVGAGSRDAGKTGFLSAVIRRWSRERPLVGVKVTVIRESGGGGCARGGEGCGVCASLGHHPYLLVEEKGDNPGKDTARLLQAGATAVYWLRVHQACMAQATAALLARAGSDAVIVAESNTFRLAVEPDLFLVLCREGETELKDSCRAVLHLADREVRSTGTTWDPAPEAIGFDGKAWFLRHSASAIILAGGSSSRMGRDKALIEVEGVPLISRIVARLDPRFEEVLVSSRNSDDYAFLGRRVIADQSPGIGPLMGLACGLEASRHDIALVLPCDLPDIPFDLVARLLREVRDVDAAVPFHADGRAEPLVAVYRRSVIPAIKAAIERGDRRIISFFGSIRVRRVPLPPGQSFRNLNSPEDLESDPESIRSRGAR